MAIKKAKNLSLKKLLEFITPKRQQTLLDKLNKRTKYLTIVIEDVYQPHNASAILRTCDAFGIQDIYIVEKENKFRPNRGISLGSEKWVNIYTFKDPEKLYKTLKNKGYDIISTVPPQKTYKYQSLPDFLPKRKSAIVLGSELKGLSDFWLKNADQYLTIPMYGFAESFNISVSAGIILYDLIHKLKNKKGFYLKKAEKEQILKTWILNEIF